MNELQVWHHGLVARYWGEFETSAGKEGQYFQKLIEHTGQPALDMGCGSGRLLLPFLQAGLDVDGCDVSEDMIAACRRRVEGAGLTTSLYVQPIHAIDLPRRYRTIFSCGMIGLGGERRLAMQGMQRVYEQLEPGGVYAFDYMVRWNDPPAWLSRLPEHRRALPQAWPEAGERRQMSDDTEIELVARTVSMDPLEEVAVRQLRARLYRGDQLVAEEIHTQKLDDYSKNELVLMLERAGFEDIQVEGDYEEQPATADSKNLVFLARK